MTFPTHDWQFYVATGIAILAALYLGRRFLPRFGRKRRAGRRTTLTVEGKIVDRKRAEPQEHARPHT